jgi:Ca2+-binding EF-hand superfamily protein
MKSSLSLLIALAAAAVSGSATAEDAPSTRPVRALPEKLTLYDANNDGRLSREEYRAYIDDTHPDAPKSPWDTDGNGRLSAAEIEVARAAMRDRLEEKFLARFTEADTGGAGENGDEADDLLTLEEFTKTLPADVSAERAKAAFDRLDADDDSKISKAEFLKFNGLLPRPHAPRPPKLRPDVAKPKPPVLPPLPEGLQQFDTDGNGILSRGEIESAIKAGTWPLRPKPPQPPTDPEEPPVVPGGE